MSLVVAGSLATPDPAGATSTEPLIATYNVFMLPQSLYPNWGQEHRADLIASEGVLSGQEIVVLNEVFDNAASGKLLHNLAGEYPNQTPVLGRSRDGWDQTLGAYSDFRPEDGGVAVISKHPITEKIQFIYGGSCGADAQSNKGFAYVKISTPSGPVHVVATHLQADDGGCAGQQAEVRKQQLSDIAGFIQNRNIPPAERVMVAGDFNIDASAGEFTDALAILGASAPAMTGHPYSYDPAANSLAKNQAPDGPSQRLDYVLSLDGHGPQQQWDNEVRAVHSPPWTVTSWGQTYTFTDFSDHYPVFAAPR